ncbi:peptide chain release factor N(5)-glutamine methyltransferase [Cereibacter sphaeroides]|nr:peptide chain release factor N(5)-glutamine methyltransferase [Cereibacter sphaeroides]
MTTLQHALRDGTARLSEAGLADAPRDARQLLAHATGLAPDRLTLHLPEPLTPEAATRYEAALALRIARHPVSHITGRRAFWGRDFVVTPDVLDPRPETETLVAEALSTPFRRVLDLGTGSGAILLSLLAERPAATGIGVDLSEAALDVARRNAHLLGITDRARLTRSDWFTAVDGTFDLIVSNPPYIAQDEMDSLSPEVLREPHMALSPGGDGLDAYRTIARGASAHMAPGARLMVEIGPTQSAAVSALFAEAGLVAITTLRDLDGRDRVVCAQRGDTRPED